MSVSYELCANYLKKLVKLVKLLNFLYYKKWYTFLYYILIFYIYS